MSNSVRYMGNKDTHFEQYKPYLPDFKTFNCWVEPFCGAAGVFHNLPIKPKYALLNDLSREVINFWRCLQTRYELLKREYELMPDSDDVFRVLRKKLLKSKLPEGKISVERAAAWLFCQNHSFLSRGETFIFQKSNTHSITVKNLESDYLRIKERVCFNNCDFREFFRRVNIREQQPLSYFIFNDPPYLDTTGYEKNKWTVTDLEDLINLNIVVGCRFCICEFDNPKVTELAAKYNLNIYKIKERFAFKNRDAGVKTEILLTNYLVTNDKQQKLII